MDRAQISEVCCHVSSKPAVFCPVPWKICRLKFQPNSTPADLFLSVWLKACWLVKLVGEVWLDWKPTPSTTGREHLCESCPAEPDCTADTLPSARQGVQECCDIIPMSIILNHKEQMQYKICILVRNWPVKTCVTKTEKSLLQELSKRNTADWISLHFHFKYNWIKDTLLYRIHSVNCRLNNSVLFHSEIVWAAVQWMPSLIETYLCPHWLNRMTQKWQLLSLQSACLNPRKLLKRIFL